MCCGRIADRKVEIVYLKDSNPKKKGDRARVKPSRANTLIKAKIARRA